MSTFRTVAVSVSCTVVGGLLVYYLTSNRNKALATCSGTQVRQPATTPLSRTFACSKSFGTLSSVESDIAACPLGSTCNAYGVCACTFNGPKPNGVQNISTEQSGALQSWGARSGRCGPTTCYAAAIRRGTSCVTQVVATQGAAGNSGFGQCSDFSGCC
jgi:hypothetical protein